MGRMRDELRLLRARCELGLAINYGPNRARLGWITQRGVRGPQEVSQGMHGKG